MSYDKAYLKTENVFGKDAEDNLIKHIDLINRKLPVLDIGAGQGRNSFYLAEKGCEVHALEPSAVAVKSMNKIIEEKKLRINTFHCEIDSFNTVQKYSAILIYGLFQILKWDEISSLIDTINNLTVSNSLVFITAWTVEDPSFLLWKNKCKVIGQNSFLSLEGEVRTYFEKNQLLELFSNYEIVYNWEGLGPKHRHGDGPIEQHGKVELIVRRR